MAMQVGSFVVLSMVEIVMRQGLLGVLLVFFTAVLGAQVEVGSNYFGTAVKKTTACASAVPSAR